MSVSAIFALLVKLATVAPHLWPLVIAAFEALEDLVLGLKAALGTTADELNDIATPRSLGDEQAAIERSIAEIEAALPADGARGRFGNGQFLLKLAGFLAKHPQLASGFGTLIGGLLGGK